MLPRKTLFVIGAGAGADIGMPLGDALSAEIARKTDIQFELGERGQISGDPSLMNTLRQIAKDRGENVNVLRAAGCLIKEGVSYSRSIDSFLNTHKDNENLKLCAKLALVQTILEHEKNSSLYVDETKSSRQFRGDLQVRRSWFSDFMYLLQEGVVASENREDVFKNLTIINFNYDRCIEQFLFHALLSTFLINAEIAKQLMGTLKIFHPYGVVGHFPWSQGKRQVGFGVTDYGDIAGLSQEIRTFNERIEEGGDLKSMREEVAAANRIVFLGFHFHPQNMELLKAAAPARGGIVDSYATAKDRSEADKTLLDNKIRTMLQDRGGSWNVHVERDCDCKKLFKDYAATWLT